MVTFNDADDFFETSAEGGGKKYRLEDIDGVGPATANKIKSVRGVQAPTDIQEMSADELADKAGISRSRAEKAIRGAGGNPNVSKRSNTGSVSAAGIKTRTGDFWVEFAAQDKARARNDPRSRSEEAVKQDERKRAPITTDLEQWKNNKSGLDFPGVDTPTQDPKALPKDYKRGGKFETTEVDEDTEVATGRDPEWERTIDGESVTSFDIAEESPEGQVPGVAPGDFEMGAGESMVADGPGGPMFNRKKERVVETDRLDQEQTPPEEALQQQAEDDSNLFQFPEWTLSRGQTYLNEKVYEEDREDLRPLREKVRRTNPGQPVQMDKGEYNTFQRIVREGAEEEIERADRMEANIFGDTDEQAEIAEQAIQGIINNPPR